MNSFKIGIFLSSIGLVTACDSPLFEFQRTFPAEQWIFADSMQFNYQHHEESTHELKVNFEVTNAYPYRNLHLKFRIQEPNGKQTTVVPDFVLQDSVGNWLTGGQEEHAFEFVLNPQAKFQSGHYQITVVQYMRMDTLPGIRSFAFRIH
ncbi:MAG: gliding motility lipoprotein GldH [Bacteroidia bacterium]|nr:gliding motility lipoprotein GldH [Bacteroidia bacterium]